MCRILLAAALACLAFPALAQNTQCSDRPAADSSNACANTRFVQNHPILPGSLTLPQGQIFVGSIANVAAAVAMSQDCTIIASGVITCLRTNNVLFGALATLTPAAGVATWLATPSSANLAAALTNETGTGLAVFSDSPTFTTNITTPLITGGTATNSVVKLRATSNGAPSGDIATVEAHTINLTGLAGAGTTVVIGGAATSGGTLTIAGGSSGSINLVPQAAASGSLIFPSATDQLVARNTTDTFTNKDFNITTNSFHTSVAINSLGANVALNNTANYFPGPSVAQGSIGTWCGSGGVAMSDSAGAATFHAKLWDGTTIIDSRPTASGGAAFTTSISLSGCLSAPAGNIRIDVRDTTSVNGTLLFNSTGNSKDSTLTMWRVQ